MRSPAPLRRVVMVRIGRGLLFHNPAMCVFGVYQGNEPFPRPSLPVPDSPASLPPLSTQTGGLGEPPLPRTFPSWAMSGRARSGKGAEAVSKGPPPRRTRIPLRSSLRVPPGESHQPTACPHGPTSPTPLPISFSPSSFAYPHRQCRPLSAALLLVAGQGSVSDLCTPPPGFFSPGVRRGGAAVEDEEAYGVHYAVLQGGVAVR